MGGKVVVREAQGGRWVEGVCNWGWGFKVAGILFNFFKGVNVRLCCWDRQHQIRGVAHLELLVKCRNVFGTHLTIAVSLPPPPYKNTAPGTHAHPCPESTGMLLIFMLNRDFFVIGPEDTAKEILFVHSL